MRKRMTMVNADDYSEDTKRSLEALKAARKSFRRASSEAPSFNPLLLPDWLTDDTTSCSQKLFLIMASRQCIFFFVWFVWLVTGTVYYATELDLGFARGFYMAVNVGYSIGWGDITTPELGSQWFSCFYVMIGASFVGAALGFFAEGVVAASDNWYTNCKVSAQYEAALKATHNPFYRAWKWCVFHWNELRAIVLWLIFVFSATIGACVTQDWPFITGLYFAVSSISTGGLQALDPSKSTAWMYGLTGLYSCLGVPLMGIAMGTVAAFIMPKQTINDTMNKIRSNITEEEVDMLVGMGLADGDGVIDKAEFMVLCMIRIGGADPMLMHLITEYFELLDGDNSGGLSIAEITTSAKSIKQKMSGSSSLRTAAPAAGSAAGAPPAALEKPKRKSLRDVYAQGGIIADRSAAERLNSANEKKKEQITNLFMKQVAAVTDDEIASLVKERIERPIGSSGYMDIDGDSPPSAWASTATTITTTGGTDPHSTDLDEDGGNKV